MSSDTDPNQEVPRPSGLATFMVKASLPDHVRAEGVAAFKDEFAEKVADRGIFKARVWALMASWDVFYRKYSSAFQLVMLLLAILAIAIAF